MEFQIADGLSFAATEWLEARGLCPDTASRMAVTSARGGRSEWVAFPTIVRGVIVGWQFRRMGEGEPRFLTAKGAAEHVWNFDVLLDETLAAEPLVITEGRCDALASIQSGFIRTISIPGGGVASPSGEVRETAYKFIADIEPLVKDCREIVLATDGDAPGRQLIDDLARRLGRGRCQFIAFPEGTKDLNGVLARDGEPAVKALVQAERWLQMKGIYLPSELPPRQRLRQHVSGFPGLDNHYRVRRQDLCVVTGYPGDGKSTFLNDLAMRMAENHNWRVCFASFEQTPQTQHMWALRRLRLGKSPDDMTAEEIRDADQWINRHFSFVIPDDDKPCDLGWLFEMFATSIVRHGADMVVADPWNELEHSPGRDRSLTQYVGEALRDWKRFLRKWDVHGVIAAHPAKVLTKPNEALPEPRLDQISDSAHWWNKADVGVIVHGKQRDDGFAYTGVRIAKSKYHDEIGKPGLVALAYNTTTGRYHECAV